MDFNLTKERQMLQDSLRRFLADHYTTENRNRIITEGNGFSAQIWSDMADLASSAQCFLKSITVLAVRVSTLQWFLRNWAVPAR